MVSVAASKSSCSHILRRLHRSPTGSRSNERRALVVDDNDAFRTLVVALLKGVADVVERAADGEVALQLARDLRPT